MWKSGSAHRVAWIGALVATALLASAVGHAQSIPPRPETSNVVRLGPLAGRYQTLTPAQVGIGFYGTDLGFTFKDGNRLRILFGDSWADTYGNAIGPISDDAQGWIDLTAFPTGASVDNWIATHRPLPGDFPWHAAAPPITYRVNGFGKVTPLFVYAGGWNVANLLPLGLGKTPGFGFSNGTNAFAYFGRNEILQCSDTMRCDGTNSLRCETHLGICANTSGENAKACVIGKPALTCDLNVNCVAPPTGPNPGVCIDPTTYPTADDPSLLLSVVQIGRVGTSDPSVPENYYTQKWMTNKFTNSTARTVREFVPGGAVPNYLPVDGPPDFSKAKVFMWGRPLWVGAKSQQRDLPLYFAYADMPQYDPNGNFTWTVHYYKGPGSGANAFTTDPTQAAELSLNGRFDGMPNDADETWDVVDQMTISYVPNIRKWIMFYGGDFHPNLKGLLAGVNAAFYSSDATHAIHARSATDPWGPWSSPAQVYSPGNPGLPGNPASPITGDYAPTGMIHDTNCVGPLCVPGELNPGYLLLTNYGAAYAPNIVDVWTTPTTGSSTDADLYWNVSTWDPYETVLMKTHVHAN